MLALLLAGLSVSGVARSEPLGHALVYIDPQDYQHEIRLWHFYYSYWFNQGQAVEPIALEALRPLFAGVGTCQDGQAADVVITIKPKMFYNPHMTTFYGSIVASTYSGSGKALATYRAEVESSGFLDVMPAVKVQAVYREAMQKIVGQMRADTALMALAGKGLAEGETKMPCQMVSILRAKQ